MEEEDKSNIKSIKKILKKYKNREALFKNAIRCARNYRANELGHSLYNGMRSRGIQWHSIPYEHYHGRATFV